jgi:hypothetical protein
MALRSSDASLCSPGLATESVKEEGVALTLFMKGAQQ